MESNLAYKFADEWPEERIDGRLVAMAPPSVNHNRVKGHIFSIFDQYLKGRDCEAFPDGTAVYLTETDYYIPDVMVVCDPDKVKPDGVHGAPDLVVEVLSPGTAYYDRGRKKTVYEDSGVREYWIVDSVSKSIEQYVLKDGRFELRNVCYAEYPDWMLVRIREEERAQAVTEFPCSLYDGFIIRLEDVFARVT